MDALSLLKQDHDKVRELLSKLTETTERAQKTRAKLFQEVQAELEVHTAIEEEIFYPALRDAAKNSEQKKMVSEAREEHRAVEELVIPDLEQTDPGSLEFGGRVKVLKELVVHHIEEEEEEMFDEARSLLDEDELEQLGQRLEERKTELLQEIAA